MILPSNLDIVIPICHTQQTLSRDSVTTSEELREVPIQDPQVAGQIKLGLFPLEVVPEPLG